MFKTTEHIKNNPFEKKIYNYTHFNYNRQCSVDDNSTNMIDIADVELWEEIYYFPGYIGIYASYKPYTEIYLVTFNYFLDRKKGYEIFKGETAANQVKDLCNSIGLDIETNIIDFN